MNKYTEMKDDKKGYKPKQYIVNRNLKTVRLQEKTQKYIKSTNSISPWLKFIYLNSFR